VDGGVESVELSAQVQIHHRFYSQPADGLADDVEKLIGKHHLSALAVETGAVEAGAEVLNLFGFPDLLGLIVILLW